MTDASATLHAPGRRGFVDRHAFPHRIAGRFVQSIRCPGFVLLQSFLKSPAAVCPATYRQNPFLVFVYVVNSIPIRLDYSLKVLKQLQCYLLCPGSVVIMKKDQLRHHCPDHPDVPFYRLVLFIVDDRDCRFITLDVVGAQNQFPEPVPGRPHQLCHILEPPVDRCRGNADTLLAEHLDLTVEGKMVHILVNKDVGQKAGASVTLRDGKQRHGSGDDRALIILGFNLLSMPK